MVARGPRRNGKSPGTPSRKSRPWTSPAVYSGLTASPSGVCHSRPSGSAPFRSFRARSRQRSMSALPVESAMSGILNAFPAAFKATRPPPQPPHARRRRPLRDPRLAAARSPIDPTRIRGPSLPTNLRCPAALRPPGGDWCRFAGPAEDHAELREQSRCHDGVPVAPRRSRSRACAEPAARAHGCRRRMQPRRLTLRARAGRRAAPARATASRPRRCPPGT